MRRAPLSIPVELREQKLLIDAPDGMLVKCDLNWTAQRGEELRGAHAAGWHDHDISPAEPDLYASTEI